MKKFLLTLVATGSLFAGNLTHSQIQNILKDNPILKNFAKYINTGYEKGDLYIFKLPTRQGMMNIYITKDKKYTFIGNAFDKNGKEIKAPINKKIIDKAIAFTFGKGKKDIYIITDPECPYCRKFEEIAKNKLEDKYRVHLILLPLSFHHNSKNMIYYILNGKNDAEKRKRFQETILKQNTNYKNFHPTQRQKAEYDRYINNVQKATSELGVTGTPSVYDKNFNFINWPTLVKQK